VLNTAQRTETWEAMEKKDGYKDKSIFDLKWTGVAVDEAHELRTRNGTHNAMKKIRDNAYAVVLSTATPLYTQTSVSTRSFP
jgi:hypothetical protein